MPLGLHAMGVAPGQGALGRGMERTTILLQPYEVGAPSEMYDFDQAFALDLKRHGSLAEALVAMARKRPCRAPLFMLRPGDRGLNAQARRGAPAGGVGTASSVTPAPGEP